MKDLRFETERKRDDDRDTVELRLNGDVYFAYRPTTNQIALFYASSGKRNLAVALAAVQTFLESTLEPEAFDLLMRAVENDTLEYEALLDLSKDIIGEFSENPPTSSAGSSTSRARTGTQSTGNSRRPAATRASTRRPASAG